MGVGGQKMLQSFLESTWKTEYGKSNNISVTYADDINQNILTSPKTFKYSKEIYEKLCTKKTTSKAATAEFPRKFPNRKKISNEDFNLCKAESSLDGAIKSVFQTNNDGLKAVFCNYFSKELAAVHLDVYDSWVKLGTIGVTSRKEIISIIMKKVIIEILKTKDPFQF